MKKLIITMLLLIPTLLFSEISYGESSVLDMGEISASVKTKISYAENVSLLAAPNPFNPSVNISIPQSLRPANVAIYNMHGKLVSMNKDYKKSMLTWNAGYLPSGIYLLKVMNGKEQKSKKLFLLK